MIFTAPTQNCAIFQGTKILGCARERNWPFSNSDSFSGCPLESIAGSHFTRTSPLGIFLSSTSFCLTGWYVVALLHSWPWLSARLCFYPWGNGPGPDKPGWTGGKNPKKGSKTGVEVSRPFGTASRLFSLHLLSTLNPKKQEIPEGQALLGTPLPPLSLRAIICRPAITTGLTKMKNRSRKQKFSEQCFFHYKILRTRFCGGCSANQDARFPFDKSLASGDFLCDSNEIDSHCTISCDKCVSSEESLASGDARFWCIQFKIVEKYTYKHIDTVDQKLLYSTRVVRKFSFASCNVVPWIKKIVLNLCVWSSLSQIGWPFCKHLSTSCNRPHNENYFQLIQMIG